METLVEKLSTEIETTIEKLKTKRFRPDPITGKHFSKIVSVMSSAYKRHGFIIERAILEQLKTNPDFVVWEEPKFLVTQIADHLVDATIDNPEKVFETESNYVEGHRSLQIDTIVLNKKTNEISSYEIKRGNGVHDAGKKRSILRDLLCVQILLKSYGRSKNFEISSARSFIIFYYGQCSIKKPFSLTREELDKHFGCSVSKEVEELNEFFRSKLFEILTD
jgi:hypothetical protein